MLIYLIAAVSGAGLLLLALKGWATLKARKPSKRQGMVYETAASKIELWVAGAEDWWPHLRVMPLFWLGMVGTTVILVLDYHFGHSRFGIYGAVFLGTLFAMADLAIPVAALEHEATDDNDRLAMSLIVICTAMSMIVVVGSTVEISTVNTARQDVGKIDYDDTRKQIETKQKERDSIPVDRGAQALADLAASTEEASSREGNRVKCGQKCEDLKKQAADYRARAKEADRKEKLTGQIEALKLKLAGGDTQTVRADADPLALGIEAMTLGYVPQQAVRRYFLTVVGLFLVLLLTLLWMRVGRDLAKAIAWEVKHRGEIADEARVTMGLKPKYTALAEQQALLAAPVPADPAMVFNIQAADVRKRYANDEQLAETMALFDKLLMRGVGGQVKVAELYRAYQVMVLSADPNSRYMTQPTMVQKLTVISQEMDGIRLTADGVLEGWVLKPPADRKQQETPNAA